MLLRFFVSLGFVLSVIAALGSFSIYKSYQTEREQRLDAESKFMQAQDSSSSAKSDMEQQKSRIADLESQIESMKNSEHTVQEQLNTKDAEIQALKTDLAGAQDELKLAQTQVENYRKKERIPAPTAAPINVPVVAETGQKTAPAAAVEPKTQAPAQAAPAVAAPEQTVIPSETPASEDSRILTVNRKFNFIVVNLGLRDGLRMGDKVEVLQGTAVKASAQIEKIYDKFSAATLLNEDKNNPVHEGDAVRKA